MTSITSRSQILASALFDRPLDESKTAGCSSCTLKKKSSGCGPRGPCGPCGPCTPKCSPCGPCPPYVPPCPTITGSATFSVAVAGEAVTATLISQTSSPAIVTASLIPSPTASSLGLFLSIDPNAIPLPSAYGQYGQYGSCVPCSPCSTCCYRPTVTFTGVTATPLLAPVVGSIVYGCTSANVSLAFTPVADGETLTGQVNYTFNPVACFTGTRTETFVVTSAP